jgi:uncharacterized membrane protein
MAAPDTGVGVGLVVASAVIPETFAPSLSRRSVVDQGLVTGLSVGLHYLLALGTHDALQAVAREAADNSFFKRSQRSLVGPGALVLAADIAAIPLGLAVQRILPPKQGEPVLRGLARQAGWRFMATGVSGALLLGAQGAVRALAPQLRDGGRMASVPLAVPVGLAVAYVRDRRHRAVVEQHAVLESEPPADRLRSFAVAGGVVGGLAGLGYVEHLVASAGGQRLASVLPGGPHLWKLAGHGTTFVLLAAVVNAVYARAMQRIEQGTATLQPVLDADEASRWTGPLVSGGPGSVVPWSTLGREGRRHVLTGVRARPMIDRPAGTPDLSIETVMGEPPIATPAQIYIGLDSAATARERVDLALAEIDRVRAFERSLIMLVSPTGTGYVNYVAVAATQYLARGDVVTVTMQYSKRPSPLSLGKIKEAREQNRLLWLQILERLRRHSGRPPRVVLFGESLGAHTSQDVFLHWGTLGPSAMGIDRALWIGTPYSSGWMHEVLGHDRFDVDPDAVAVVNDFAQYEQLCAARVSRPRYVLVSHDNDGVTKFGLDLLVTPPPWLSTNRRQQEAPPGASPRGVPPLMRWRPITTFFQSLIDMKNAQIPGEYRAWAHDYRPDLARFVSEVFDLPASAQQMAAVEAALRQRESVRQDLFEAASGAASR